MRKLKGTKMGKRILSVVLALGMVLTMLPIADRGMTSQAAGGGNIQKYSTGSKDVIRGDLNNISELPQYNDKAGWKSKQVGTAQRPFFILEIVPYKEYAEMGYLIGGCEPVKIHELQGHQEPLSNFLSATLGTVYTETMKQMTPGEGVDNIFFFRDEPEGQPSFYSSYESTSTSEFWNDKDKISYASLSHSTDTTTKNRYLVEVKGYYEIVDKSKNEEGYFTIETDEVTGKRSIVPGSNFPDATFGANVVWHSLNPNIDGNGDLSDIRFNDDLNNVRFSEPGDRLYTVRKSTEADWALNVLYTYNYVSYENQEIFLHDVLGLNKESAKGYSAVVKTITPTELNATPEWVEYADLITMSPKTHGGLDGGKTFEVWEKHNHFGNKRAEDPITTNVFDTFDLSSEVVMKIVDKNARESTYAPLLVDSTIYGQFTDKKDNLTYQIYDFNLDPISAADRGQFTGTGYNNNIYKMLVMLVMQKPSIVRNIFWDHIDASGDKIALKDLQDGDSKQYWNQYIFQLVEKEHFLKVSPSCPGGENKVNYWQYIKDSQDKYWPDYNYAFDLRDGNQIKYVQNRVYAYQGDNSIAQLFRAGSTALGTQYDQNTKDKYKDFREYLEKDAKTRELWDEFKDQHHAGQSLNENTAPPSAALRYLLGIGDYDWPGYSGVLKVLDVEPGVGVNPNYTPNWLMKDTYFHMLLPNFTGDIEITHMTMNKFVGMAEDLNSTYDLIYFGADSNAFWQKDITETVNNETKVVGHMTDFVDSENMDGLVYFHMGDTAETAEGKNKSQTGIRIADFGTEIAENSKALRFPGNDITKLKLNEVISFIKGNSPVLAESELYDGVKVKDDSNVWTLLKTEGVYKTTDADTPEKVEDLLRASRKGVEFTESPALYDESTYIDGTRLVVKFRVPNYSQASYSYKFYIDQNRNGKFEAGETEAPVAVTSMEQTASRNVSDLLGLVQWRIEVYNTNNENERYSLEGCSAISRSSAPGTGSGSGEKKLVKVLQIEPTSGVNNADLTRPEYSDLYNNLKDFDVEVDKITWKQFEGYFEGTDFAYDMGSPIVEGVNPKNKAAAESVTGADGKTKPGILNSDDELVSEKLSNYNMIVVGFADNYDNTDLSDKNGAAEYLYYFAEAEGSILFTHDTTSLYNEAKDESVDAEKPSGYTANAMLRDLMGMNRYGITSNKLPYVRSSEAGVNLAGSLAAYRSKVSHDTANYSETQAFTMNAMRKMMFGGENTPNYRNPYRFMVIDPAKATLSDENFDKYVTDLAEDHRYFDNYEKYAKLGMYDDLCATTCAVRLNVGQITQYPYVIDEVMPIALTHSQWYQLNMEDPDLTVWYTLETPESYGGPEVYASTYTPDLKTKLSSAVASLSNSKKVYAASPQDAANNYYIYSKGNIFYSGVGHSPTYGAENEMERKLFINTLIAAYRPKYTAPEIEVTNKEASKNGNSYTIRVPKEINEAGGSYVIEGVDDGLKVTFKLVDGSLSTNLKCRIYFGEKGQEKTSVSDAAEGITTITNVATGEVLSASEDGWFTSGLKNETEYIFDYPKSLSDPHPDLIFEARNDRRDESGFAYLKIQPQPLFMLD